MTPAMDETISCRGCGKKYVRTPEMAGKNVRCKCGQIIFVPAAVVEDVQLELIDEAPPQPSGDDLYELREDPKPVARAMETPREPSVDLPVGVHGLPDDEYHCPSCDYALEPGTIICASCGFNIKTGQKVRLHRDKPVRPAGTKPAGFTQAAAQRAKVSESPAAVPTPASSNSHAPNLSAFGGIPRRTPPKVVEDKKGELIKILIPVGLAIVIVLSVVLFRVLTKKSGGNANPMNTGKGDDPKVAELVDEYGGMEVHKWFNEDSNRMAGPLSMKQAVAKADDLQQMGAKQVLAFGSRMTRTLAIELPDDPDKRKALFEWEKKWAIEHQYKPSKDEGQKYLLIDLGL